MSQTQQKVCVYHQTKSWSTGCSKQELYTRALLCADASSVKSEQGWRVLEPPTKHPKPGTLGNTEQHLFSVVSKSLLLRRT